MQLFQFSAYLKNKEFKLLFLTLLFVVVTILVCISRIKLRKIQTQEGYSRDYDDISCYDLPDDTLPSADGLNFPEDSIFFIETSCLGTLNSRQACSIESAARANPYRNVIVMFAGPLHAAALTKQPFKALKRIGSVQFVRIHVKSYSKNTIIEPLFARQYLSNSKYRVLHSSDALRILTLSKYGGVYLDLDVVVVASLDRLPTNFVPREDNVQLATFVLALSKDEIGETVSEECLRDLLNNYNPELRNWNGPLVLHKVLGFRCSTKYVQKMNAKTCQGFHVLDERKFCPVPYSDASAYFRSMNDTSIFGDVYTHHLWNDITHKMPVHKNSYYTLLAKKFCPLVYNSYGEKFGA